MLTCESSMERGCVLMEHEFLGGGTSPGRAGAGAAHLWPHSSLAMRTSARTATSGGMGIRYAYWRLPAGAAACL